MYSQFLLTSPPPSSLIITIPDNIIEYHGFLLWRHESNEATYIAYKSAQGDQKVIAVKDAKFRSVQKFGTYDIDTPLQNFDSYGSKSSGWCIDGTDTELSVYSPALPMPERINQDLIYDQWSSYLKSDKTAKENCDVWITYKNITDSIGILGVPAVEWCRNQRISNIPCDLPNAYQNICIWVCSDKLDEIDPTANNYPTLKLGYTNQSDQNNARTHYDPTNGLISTTQWCSTEYTSNRVRKVNYCGDCSYIYKGSAGLAIPILEFQLN